MKPNLTKPLAVFDIESTGVVVGKDRIVEIFVIRIDPDHSEHEFHAIVNPGIKIPQEVIDIHGITNEDVADKPSFKEVAPKLVQFLENADLAGYNSNKFDIPLLVEEFIRADVEFDYSKRRFIDIMGIFHKMEPRNLRAAYKFYCEKDLINAHSAKADTQATWEIFQAQLSRYENVEVTDNEGNISTPIVNDMEALSTFSKTNRNADLVGHIVFNKDGVEVLNFGKYKGTPVQDVFKKEPSYYDWMMKSQFPESTKRLISQIKLRSFNSGNVKLS
ncbi:MAG: DNA polymerase III subunit epsilon [Marinilabiliales bacterium]|nr:MAG: DNA polymerase III subunit epsilon [Marinilabiliales bacterium]